MKYKELIKKMNKYCKNCLNKFKNINTDFLETTKKSNN